MIQRVAATTRLAPDEFEPAIVSVHERVIGGLPRNVGRLPVSSSESLRKH